MILAELPPTFLLGMALVLGLLFGSFSNVVIYRLPRGESVAFPASHCPACAAPIRPYDNLPVLGFALLRGRARCCGVKIPWRYPIMESLGGLWSVAMTQNILLDLPGSTPFWQVSLLFVAYLAFGIMLLIALFIDIDHMILPDVLTVSGAILGLATAQWLREISWQDSLIGAAAGYAGIRLLFVEGYKLLRGQAGMGLGDAKLLMLTGAWFGWRGVLFSLLIGSILGTIVTLCVVLTQGKLEEPDSVIKEREEALALLETLEGEERKSLEAELAEDPLFAPPAKGLAGARLAFGPFLVVTTLAFPLVGPWLITEYWLLLLA